jgi:hypothetical protein
VAGTVTVRQHAAACLTQAPGSQPGISLYVFKLAVTVGPGVTRSHGHCQQPRPGRARNCQAGRRGTAAATSLLTGRLAAGRLNTAGCTSVRAIIGWRRACPTGPAGGPCHRAGRPLMMPVQGSRTFRMLTGDDPSHSMISATVAQPGGDDSDRLAGRGSAMPRSHRRARTGRLRRGAPSES